MASTSTAEPVNSPPQSPLVRPTRYTGLETPGTTKHKRNDHADGDNEYRTPTSKRKRVDGGVGDNESRTPTKRLNTFQDIPCPETSYTSSAEGDCITQQLTPMKRSHAIMLQTPSTIAKSPERFHRQLALSPTAEIGDSFESASNMALSPLVRPMMMDFAFTENVGAASCTAKQATIHKPIIDLDTIDAVAQQEHAGPLDANNQTSEVPIADPGTPFANRPSNPTEEQSAYHAGRLAPPNSPVGPPLPNHPIATPQKTPSKLQHIPAIAPAYVPSYISPDSAVKLRDAKQFSIRPPYWKRWPESRYARLATFVQETVNCTPFAEQEKLTIEEVAHVVKAVVIEPLLDETEKLAAVGEKRIEATFETFNKDAIAGTRWRSWGRGNGVKAELGGVRPGIVLLIGKEGEEIEVSFRQLDMKDREFVWGQLTEGERRILMREGEASLV